MSILKLMRCCSAMRGSHTRRVAESKFATRYTVFLPNKQASKSPNIIRDLSIERYLNPYCTVNQFDSQAAVESCSDKSRNSLSGVKHFGERSSTATIIALVLCCASRH